ncbi:MAG: T9SS type A sorting domain-containing protein, partial [Bacteroidaceae bacterium]|nr:T9SS type A sorting domain-containing protein [Bacteroidaceae bacterium]
IDTSNQTLYLSGEVSGVRSVSILSSNGSVLYRTMSFPDKGINVSQLPKGIYYIAIMTPQGLITRSVLK